jgi:hypothetical protein
LTICTIGWKIRTFQNGPVWISILAGCDMHRVYASTLTINAWKEHTCVGCGATFRYRFHREKSGYGHSPAWARGEAQVAVMRALTWEVDRQPCPSCGLYQPDMVSDRKVLCHNLVTLAALFGSVGLIVLLVHDCISLVAATWLIAALCGITGMMNCVIDFLDPSRNLKQNRQLAGTRVQQGELLVVPEVVQGVESRRSAPRGSRNWLYTTAPLLLVIGLIALGSPEVYRASAGLKWNAGWHPLFVGPGDRPRLYYPHTIRSVKGYWAGTAKVEVRNWQELGLPNPVLEVSSNSGGWGNEIRLGNNEPAEQTVTPWVRVFLPQDPRLEWKELDLQVNLDVRYPQMQPLALLLLDPKNEPKWPVVEEHLAPIDTKLVLSPADSCLRYRIWWLAGTSLGVFLTLVSGGLQSLRWVILRRRALPSRVLFPSATESPRPPGDAAPIGPNSGDPPARESEHDEADADGTFRSQGA